MSAATATRAGADAASAEPAAADAPPDGAYLRIEALEKRYNANVAAVDGLNLAVPKGELVALLGPSGCGKTTTLRMIAGLLPATRGRIVVAGRDVTTLPPYRRDMGLVFQNYALFPHMTAARNVAFGLEMRRLARAEVERRVKAALALVRLESFAERRPRELSGGQQQRVALARALVIEPTILLLDEPLSNLDAKLREEMRIEIRDIQQRLGTTAVFVTHDQVEALSMCDTVAVMHEGRLAQLGTPVEIYERPRTPFVAAFVGRINRLDGARDASGRITVGPLRVRADDAEGSAGPVRVMVRPHRVEIHGDAPPDPSDRHNACAGRVARATYVGDIIQYDVDVGPATIQVERPTVAGPRPFTVDAPVTLRWRASDTLVFGADA